MRMYRMMEDWIWRCSNLQMKMYSLNNKGAGNIVGEVGFGDLESGF